MKKNILKRIVSAVTVCTLCLQGAAAVTAAEANPKQNFFNTAANAFYNMLDKVADANGYENTASHEFEDVEGIGKALKTVGNGQYGATSITTYAAWTPKESAKYFAFMYRYTGNDSTSQIFYWDNNNHAEFKKDVPIQGDGEWRVAVADFSDQLPQMGANINWYRLRYFTDKAEAYATPFESANYNIFKNNPLITSVDADLAPQAGAAPITDIADGNYTVNEVTWSDENGDAVSEFEANKTYNVHISLTANENYLFADSGYELSGANSTTASVDSHIYGNTLTLDAEYDTKPLEIVYSDIEDGSTDIEVINTEMNVKFSKKINIGSIYAPGAITVSPSVGTAIQVMDDFSVKIRFSGVLERDTEYTVTFSDLIESERGQHLAGKSITFRTASEITAPKIASSTPENGADCVPKDTQFEVSFDMMMDKSTLTNDNISVSPETDFSISATASGFTLTFAENLQKGTEYAVTMTDGIKSFYGSSLAQSEIKFTTVPETQNLIANGFLDDHENLDMFNDLTGGKNVRYEETGGGWNLRWKAPWDTAPILSTVDYIPGHTYFITADIMAENADTIWFDAFTSNEDGATYRPIQRTGVNENQRITLSGTFSAPNSLEYSSASMRIVCNKANTVLHIYSWEMYDMTVAEQGAGNVVDTDPSDNATECPIENYSIKLVFDKAVKPDTVKSGIQSDASVKSVELSRNLTECTIYFNKLAVNKTYSVSTNSALKTLYGADVNAKTVRFSTYSVPDGEMSVVSSAPSDNAENTAIKDLVLSAELSTYADPETLTADNITASADIIDKIEQNGKTVNIYLKNLTENTQYSVTLSQNVKSLTGYPLIEKTISFKTKTREYMISKFNEAVSSGDANIVKTYLGGEDFSDMQLNCDIYEYFSKKQSGITDIICASLLGSAAVTDAEIEKIINGASAKATLENSNDTADIDFLIKSNCFGMAQESKDTYDKYIDEKGKTNLCNAIIAGAAADNTAEKVQEKVMLAALKQANGYLTVKNVLALNKNLFPASYNMSALLLKVDAYAYPARVYSKLQNADKASYGEVYSALNSAYNSESNPGTGGTTSNPGTGGSSSSGGGGAYILKNDIVEKPTEIFNDIANVSWAKTGIEALYDKGVISGRAEGIFAPTENVTREEFTKMLVLVSDSFDENASVDFDDVKGSWAYAYIASAVKDGLVKGISGTQFGTGMNITREDAATLVWRLATKKRIKPAAAKNSFNDLDKTADYAKEAVSFLQNNGIVQGDDDGNYNPKSFLTRAEAAALLYRLIQLF